MHTLEKNNPGRIRVLQMIVKRLIEAIDACYAADLTVEEQKAAEANVRKILEEKRIPSLNITNIDIFQTLAENGGKTFRDAFCSGKSELAAILDYYGGSDYYDTSERQYLAELAISQGRARDILLLSKPDVFSIRKFTDKRGDTLLHYAVAKGDIKLIEFLLHNHIVETPATNIFGETALDIALENKNFDVFCIVLIYEMCNIPEECENKNKYISDLILRAIDAGLDLESTKTIIYESQINSIVLENEVLDKLLHMAVKNSDLNYTKLLLEYGANPNALNTSNGGTALHTAISSRNPQNTVKIITTLVEAGANLNIRQNHRAATHSPIELIEMLFRDTIYPDTLRALETKAEQQQELESVDIKYHNRIVGTHTATVVNRTTEVDDYQQLI